MMAFCAIFVFLIGSPIVKALEEGCMRLEDVKDAYVPPKVIPVIMQGNLYSPGFEKNENYPDSVMCAYQLRAPTGMHIRLKFNELDIDVTDHCSADQLILHDFDSEGVGVIQFSICGTRVPFDYVSQSRYAQLTLKTDDFAGGRGFNITYSIQYESDVCNNSQKQCKNRNCVDYYKLCDGMDDCGDGTDEENCGNELLELTECGKPIISPVANADNDRIVGGNVAIEGSWPWIASIQYKRVEPNGHICGGALINSQWVLTAAHCFTDGVLRKASSLRIHLGKQNKFDKGKNEQIRYVERMIIYDNIPPAIFEEDGEFDVQNDIALIKLNAPVKYTKYVKPICLPDDFTEEPDFRSHCYTAGWGETRGSGSSDALKQAWQPVQPDIMCRRLVGEDYTPKTMICAGSMAPMNGVCHGDSGGPLACELKKEWTVVGVASFVTAGTGDGGLCGLKGKPSVFSRVSSKVKWIRRMINRYG